MLYDHRRKTSNQLADLELYHWQVFWEAERERQKQTGRLLVLALVLAVMFMVWSGSFLQAFHSQLKTVAIGLAGQSTPSADVQRDIQVLKAEMGILMSESLEKNLGSIEMNLRLGKVVATDVEALGKLKYDIRRLKTHWIEASSFTPKEAVPAHQLDNPQRALMGAGMAPEVWIRSFAYLIIAALSLLMIWTGWRWLKGKQRLRAFENHLAGQRPPLLSRYKDTFP